MVHVELKMWFRLLMTLNYILLHLYFSFYLELKLEHMDHQSLQDPPHLLKLIVDGEKRVLSEFTLTVFGLA